MKKIFYIAILFNLLFADVHYAKIEPYQTVTIKSEVSGRVTMAKKELEGSVVTGQIVQIDDKLNKIDLQHSIESLKLIKKMIKLNQEMLPWLKSNMEKKELLYKKVVNLSSTSVNQKNSIYSAFVSSKTQYNGTLEKILNLKEQKINLEQKIALLKDTISKKNIALDKKYLYNLNVQKGEFVNIGLPIATISDISRAKIVLYLNEDELKNINSKKIYINGKETDLKFSKIWKIADKKYISSYRAEIIIKPEERFSELVKVEIK